MRTICKSITSLILCIIMLLSIVGCTTTAESKPEEDLSLPQQPVVSGELHADIATDELMSKFGLIYSFGSDEYENYIFWCEAEMTDFYIVELYPDVEMWTTNGIHLFDAEKIAPNEAINYRRTVPEGFPTDAVVYTALGTTYMYAIGYNGRDGGITLVEIDRLFVDGNQATDNTSDSADTEAVTTTSTTTTTKTTTTTTKATTTTTTATASSEFMAEIFWVSNTGEVFPREMTIESNSKWHVWKALKQLNEAIPTSCSFLGSETIKGRNGVVVLDFSDDLLLLEDFEHGHLILQAIANTYIEAYGWNAIRFKVEGEYLDNTICGYSEEFGYTDF